MPLAGKHKAHGMQGHFLYIIVASTQPMMDLQYLIVRFVRLNGMAAFVVRVGLIDQVGS